LNRGSAPDEFPPPSVDWWITSRCNLACDFCYGPIPGKDPADLRDEILRSLKDSSVPVVTFCGGEPLLVRKVDQYAGILRSAGKRTVLNTNGELLARRHGQGFQLRNFDLVGLSIEGSTAETHQAMRGARASLADTLRAAQLVTGAGIQLKIGTVVSAVNAADLPALARRVQELRPAVWRLYQYSERGVQNVGQHRHRVTDQEFHRLAEQAATLAAPVPVASSAEAETAGCLIVDPSGAVLRPTDYGYEECGNCLNEPLDDVWTRIPGRSMISVNKRWLSVLDQWEQG
jgi:MoaA/NifB/PqqE/SkfB family radical SAM enzyme